MSAIVLTKPISSGTGSSSIAGLTTSIINGQPMLTLADSTRSNKVLSVSEQVWPFGENQIMHLDWIRPVGTANDADSGFVADFDGTVTSVTAHCENANGFQKFIRLYVDEVDVGTVAFLDGTDNSISSITSLNFDFTQGQKIRLRAVNDPFDKDIVDANTIQDTVIKLTVKWKAE